ncbi:MAG: DUF4139 domain-containing protein [Chitinophagaceae bacterium]|nr:DUF4139 domain-containing protein [Chitinophagaceae bacterium]MCW5925927.1 DUF4139 domain-containing protein [Chitinophagaceae bacterium]
MLKYFLPVVAVLLSAGVSFAADKPQKTNSSLTSVTVYRSGAEMQHKATATLQQGSSELIIEGVSNAVDINSIQVNCRAAVTILGVEFSSNFLQPAKPSDRMLRLKDSLGFAQKEKQKIQVQIATLSDLLEVLKANKDIKGSQTGLSVAELVKLMDYYKQKSQELQEELAIQNEKQKALDLRIARLNSQVAEEEKKNTTKSGQVHLQLSVAASGSYDFTLSYITPNAYWTPCYDIRVDNINKPLQLIYKSKIIQTTGIDWEKVKLSLSTSVPNQWGNAPVLKSWLLSYINPITAMDKMLEGKVGGVETNRELEEVVVVGYGTAKIRGAVSADDEMEPLYVVNGAPMSKSEFSKLNPSVIKKMEVLKEASATSLYGARAAGGAILVTLKEGLSDYVTVSDNQLNVVFDIALPYDVPTNGKAQTAILKEHSIASDYKFYTVPKLDVDAYLLADIAGWEKLNLLPGEANIIFEGTYVGKSFIDPANISDTLNLTLGRDKRVVVKKEKLVDLSSVKFLGSNKLQKLTYEITVRNNKKDPVKLLLKDQYPIPTLKEIEVELLDKGEAVVDKETGLLSWNLSLAPNETRKLRFTYSVKYPKDRTINLN